MASHNIGESFHFKTRALNNRIHFEHPPTSISDFESVYIESVRGRDLDSSRGMRFDSSAQEEASQSSESISGKSSSSSEGSREQGEAGEKGSPSSSQEEFQSTDGGETPVYEEYLTVIYSWLSFAATACFIIDSLKILETLNSDHTLQALEVILTAVFPLATIAIMLIVFMSDFYGLHILKYAMAILQVRVVISILTPVEDIIVISEHDSEGYVQNLNHHLIQAFIKLSIYISLTMFNTLVFMRVFITRSRSRLWLQIATGAGMLAGIAYFVSQLVAYLDFEYIAVYFLYYVAYLSLTVKMVKVVSGMSEISLREVSREQKENEKYKLIIDSAEEGLLIINKGEVTFANHIAKNLLPVTEDLFNEKMFFLFREHSEKEEIESQLCQKKEDSKPAILEGLSLHQILSSDNNLLDMPIFTLQEGLASCENMDQIQVIIDAAQNKREDFNFFMIRTFPLKNGGDEVVVQLVDFSMKILKDSLETENKYMSYMNSCVSHEMRNPLNSISSQVQILKVMVGQTEQLMKQIIPKVSLEEKQALKNLHEQLETCVRVCDSSNKLLNFNVEDILALPQLKDGRLQKNVSLFNIQAAAEEIMQIQSHQAKERQISTSVRLFGFRDSPLVPLDEKRFQQVLLNFQSNALKFIKKRTGKLCIVLSLIPREGAIHHSSDDSRIVMQFVEEARQFFGMNFLRKEDLGTLFTPGHRDKVVLSVIDNGVGIRDEDQGKLFRLFGCLKSTRSLNTQGIGLGLVISKMISEYFGGEVSLNSRFNTGSIFHATFELQSMAQSIQSNALHLPSIISSTELGYREKILASNYLMEQRMAENYARALKTRDSIQFNQKNILIIDDEAFNCEAASNLIKILKLPNAEERIHTALSGEDALAQIKAEMVRDDNGKMVCNYGLILSDCSMPFMDGYECTSRILQLFHEHRVAEDDRPEIVAITGHVEPEFQRKAILSGMNNVFAKPLKLTIVASLLLSHNYSIELPASIEKEMKEGMDRILAHPPPM